MNHEFRYQSILAATDFSPSADAAIKQAMWVARQSGAQIVLANTVPDLSRSVHWSSLEIEVNQRELFQRSEASMREVIADMHWTDMDVKFRTLVGEPFVEITHAVQAEAFSLVLVGSRGRGIWEQLFVGSTAKRLIRKCPSSVWIVKAEHVGPPKVVVAATDFSEISLKAVKEGLWVAGQSSAVFHLVHIIDSKDVPEDIISRIPPGSSLRQEINETAAKRLEEFLSSLTVDRAKIQVHLSWGTPWQEIRRISQHNAADLIVVGTVGRSGITGMLLGNTAERILDTCDCSILTVKPDGFVSPIVPAS